MKYSGPFQKISIVSKFSVNAGVGVNYMKMFCKGEVSKKENVRTLTTMARINSMLRGTDMLKSGNKPIICRVFTMPQRCCIADDLQSIENYFNYRAKFAKKFPCRETVMPD
jgi:hypothetical protein